MHLILLYKAIGTFHSLDPDLTSTSTFSVVLKQSLRSAFSRIIIFYSILFDSQSAGTTDRPPFLLPFRAWSFDLDDIPSRLDLDWTHIPTWSVALLLTTQGRASIVREFLQQTCGRYPVFCPWQARRKTCATASRQASHHAVQLNVLARSEQCSFTAYENVDRSL